MFKKYIHLERLSSEEVEGLLDQPCFILPKLDGANASIWWDGEILHCGSRNQELTKNNTLQGFFGYVEQNAHLFIPFFEKYPTSTIYGEWLTPHSLKGYISTAWKKFYAFDVLTYNIFWSHNIIRDILMRFGIEVIPAIGKTSDLTPEEALEICAWLMQDGHKHEGVVIKRDDFVNKWGRTTYAKMVREDFKYKDQVSRQTRLAARLNGEMIEEAIALDFVSDHLINKEIAKIQNERGYTRLEPKMIGETMGKVWHALITEEIWDILKKYRNPKIDFSLLRKLCDQKIKDKFGV